MKAQLVFCRKRRCAVGDAVGTRSFVFRELEFTAALGLEALGGRTHEGRALFVRACFFVLVGKFRGCGVQIENHFVEQLAPRLLEQENTQSTHHTTLAAAIAP